MSAMHTSSASVAGAKPSIPAAGVEQHPLQLSIALHLLPGVLTGLGFFLLGPTIQRSGYPPFAAQCIADMLLLAPFILGLLYYLGYKRNGRLSLDGIVLNREKVGWRVYLLYVPIVFVAAGLIPLLAPVSNFIYARLFAWWPAAYNVMPDLSQFTRSRLMLSFAANFVVITLMAPILEEMYFRGFLLPRLSRFGLWAVPLHSLLFALFHVWTPWMVAARAVGLLPLIYVAQRKRNIYIGMVAHMLGNFLDVVAGVAFILRM